MKPSGTAMASAARRASSSRATPVATAGAATGGGGGTGRAVGREWRSARSRPGPPAGASGSPRGPFGLLDGDVAASHQGLGVELAHRPLVVDDGVHPRLGVARVVALVVAVAAVAHKVDHHVLVERLAETERQAGGPHARFGVVAVDVEHGRLDHLGHVGRVQRGARRLGGGGEAQLVVHHHVDGAAGPVPGELGQLEGLGHHALAREGGVAVDEDRQHGSQRWSTPRVLLGPDHALHDGVDGLEMRRVRGQGDGELDSPAGQNLPVAPCGT